MSWPDLQVLDVGRRVEFEIGEGQKGPRPQTSAPFRPGSQAVTVVVAKRSDAYRQPGGQVRTVAKADQSRGECSMARVVRQAVRQDRCQVARAVTGSGCS